MRKKPLSIGKNDHFKLLLFLPSKRRLQKALYIFLSMFSKPNM